jgi:hypothetical protein
MLMSASLLIQAEIEKEYPGNIINVSTRTYTPKKFAGDPISWWVFEQEHDIPALRKETEAVLQFAQTLKKNSTYFAKDEYRTLDELRLEYISFSNKNQEEIQGLLKYVE